MEQIITITTISNTGTVRSHRLVPAYVMNIPIARWDNPPHTVALVRESSVNSGNSTFDSGNYWSSSENNSNNSWYVNFNNGNTNNNNKTNNYRVRCVREFSVQISGYDD